MTEQPPVPPPGGDPPLSPGAPYPPLAPGQPVGASGPPHVDGLSVARQQLSTQPETYTPWIRRVRARIIDGLLLFVVVVIVGVIGKVIIAVAGGTSCTTDQNTGVVVSCGSPGLARIVAWIVILAPLAFLVWNEGYRQGRTGSSIGKSVLKFKVVSERTGKPIGFGMSLVRYFAHTFDIIICYIGFLLPLVTAKRQTIADMIMKTVCLPIESTWAPPQHPPQPAVEAATWAPPEHPPMPPSARRSRTLWIIAGAAAVVVVVIVAVLAFVFIGHESASRQVVLPFTGLKNPEGVAVDNTGAVYVVDQGNNRVLKLPAGATTPTTLPFTGLNKPSAVAVDTTGAVYVTDSGDNRVLKLPAGATTPTTLPFPGLSDPDGVAVDSAGAVYVANAAATDDVADQGNNRVLKLAAGATGPTTLPFTLLGKPKGVAVDTPGTVYVVVGGVLRLTAGATTPDTLPFAITNASFGGACGVAVDTAGTVYITHPYFQRVVKLAAGSTTQVVLPFTGLGQPYGVAVDSAGNLYVTDSTNRVVKLPAG